MIELLSELARWLLFIVLMYWEQRHIKIECEAYVLSKCERLTEKFELMQEHTAYRETLFKELKKGDKKDVKPRVNK